jgi:hypothetical protein
MNVSVDAGAAEWSSGCADYFGNLDLSTIHHARHWGPEDRWGTESLHAPRRIKVLCWGNDEEKGMIETELVPLKKLGTKEINFVGQSLSQSIEDARIQTPESP